MLERYKLIARVALLFVAAGLVVAPLDISIQRDRKNLRFGGRGMSLKLREQMGQGLAIAFLGGFRGLVADLLWIKLHHEWEQGSDPGAEARWARIPPLGEAVIALQPQHAPFYDLLAWHYIYNFYHRELYNPKEPDPRKRRHNATQWMLRGEALLLEGVRNIPYDAELFAALARVYDDRFKFDDPDKAAKYWQLSLDKQNRPPYAHRMVGHSLHRAAFKSGDLKKFRAAFDWWSNIWLRGRDNPNEFWEPVRRETMLMRELCLHFGVLTPDEDNQFALQEAALNLPPHERIFAMPAAPRDPTQWRKRFDTWVIEWIAPRGENLKIWEFVRAQVAEARLHVALSEDEEDWYARREEQLEIPVHDRLFKRKPAPPTPAATTPTAP